MKSFMNFFNYLEMKQTYEKRRKSSSYILEFELQL